MAKLANDAEVFFGDTVLRTGLLSERQFGEQYSRLMRRLYPDISPLRYTNPQYRREALERPDCVMAFAVYDGQIVSTAEALLLRSEPVWNVIGGNIITLEHFERQGFGTLVHDALEAECCQRWGSNRELILALTNNESKGNAQFYLTRGWNATGTTVYAKKHTPNTA